MFLLRLHKLCKRKHNKSVVIITYKKRFDRMLKKEKNMNKYIKVEVIKQYMREHHLTHTAFCKKCNISYATLQKILNDDIHIRTNSLLKVALAMNVHSCVLLY